VRSRSDVLTAKVAARVVAPPAENDGGTTVLIEWESEFSPHYNTWISREATPLCGRYSSYNSDVHRMHAHWLMEAGVDGKNTQGSLVYCCPREHIPR